MPTTRSSHLLRRVLGLAAVPALLLAAAACGDDDDSAGGGASFCEDARALEANFSDAGASDADAFGDVIAAFNELDPPAEIAEDWETMLGSLETLSDAQIADPDSIDENDFADAQAASERVTTYMEEECGISG